MPNQTDQAESSRAIVSGRGGGSSSTDKQDYRINLLNDNNYITWKWQIEMLLKIRGLYEVVTAQIQDPAKNRQAAMLLASTLSEQNMQRVINCTTGSEIWNALESNFENKSSTEKTMLMEKFTSYRIRSIRDVSKGIGELQSYAAKLKSLGMTIEEDFIISVLLQALPESLKTWKSTWKMVNAEKLNLNNLITGVMAEISEMKDPENCALLAQQEESDEREPSDDRRSNKTYKNHKANQRRFGNRTGRLDRSQDTCNYCKKKGHWARDCQVRIRDAARNSTDNGEERRLAMTAIYCGKTQN